MAVGALSTKFTWHTGQNPGHQQVAPWSFKLPPSASSFVQFCGSLSARPLQTVGNPSCETRSQGSERLQDAQSGMAASGTQLCPGKWGSDWRTSVEVVASSESTTKTGGSNQHFETTGGLMGMRAAVKCRQCEALIGLQERKHLALS